MTLAKLLENNSNYTARCTKGHGTDKETLHGYVSSFYEENFLKFRDRNIDLLEIGVQFGGSLYLWNDYFQQGNIYGVDVVDLTDETINMYSRIKRFIHDAYDEKFSETLPDFDIIIDDGPHTLESFIKCLDLYLPKLKNGGLLIIEDIPDLSYIEKISKHAKNFKRRIIDTREKYKKSDNIMFIVSKDISSTERGRILFY